MRSLYKLLAFGIDGGAHFYDVYECQDGKYLTVACAEPQFYELLLDLMQLDDPELRTDRMNPARWPDLKARLVVAFKSRTRDEWCAILEGTDACVTPMLDFAEAPRHPHNVARKAFITLDGVTQPAPAPRFSRTPSAIQKPPSAHGGDTQAVLADWGFASAEIARMQAERVVT